MTGVMPSSTACAASMRAKGAGPLTPEVDVGGRQDRTGEEEHGSPEVNRIQPRLALGKRNGEDGYDRQNKGG